jgi:hypothetical protein
VTGADVTVGIHPHRGDAARRSYPARRSLRVDSPMLAKRIIFGSVTSCFAGALSNNLYISLSQIRQLAS